MDAADPTSGPIARLRERIRDGSLSPLELTRRFIERLDRLEPKIHAFIAVLADSALSEAAQREQSVLRGEALGPLHGIPIAIKDLADVAGCPTTGGSRLFRDHLAREDATVVARLRSAGAIILGKTNLHELAYGVTTQVSAFGPTFNPWNLTRIPGGSSGGSAAAVAAGMVAAAVGTDTGGSIRIPSALCGLVGLKPTFGRVSCHGVWPLAWSLDHVGPMTHTVEDAALMLHVMAGHDRLDPVSLDRRSDDFEGPAAAAGLRVGVDPGWCQGRLHPAMRAAFDRSLDHLSGIGMDVVEVDVPATEELHQASITILRGDASAIHAELLREHASDYQPAVRERLTEGLGLLAVDYARARRATDRIRRQCSCLFERVDLLATPMCCTPAPTAGVDPIEWDGESMSVLEALTRFTRYFNSTGFPAITVPCGLSSDGLPLGLQLAANAWQEATLLGAAAAFERAVPPIGLPKV